MKKIIITLYLLALLFFYNINTAQAPAIQWQKTLGGRGFHEAHISAEPDHANSIQQTTDGGYIATGSTGSNGDVTCLHEWVETDYWIIKLTATGAIQWQKTLGGGNSDEAYSIQQTADGGYIVAGNTGSINGDVTENHGSFDYWIVKLTTTGTIEWQKSLGGTDVERAYSIRQTTDGGYIVAGSSNSNNGDVTGNHGSSDYWIVKLAATGTLQWQKTLGGTSYDDPTSILQTTDGGYIVAGMSTSTDGDIIGNHGESDCWIVKLTPTGMIQWQKTLGGTNIDDASSIQQTADGGYIVAGFSESNDGDVAGNHGRGDCWIVKLTPTGTIQWQKTLGGTNGDGTNSIQQTTNGGYIVAGFSESNDGDVAGNHGRGDCWIVKLAPTGTIQWQKTLGGTNIDEANGIQQTTDGGYIVVGNTSSNDGDVTGNHGGYDYWIVKLGP